MGLIVEGNQGGISPPELRKDLASLTETLDQLLASKTFSRSGQLRHLLVYLRDFASPEGVLPTDFDALVRESFGDLLAAGAL